MRLICPGMLKNVSFSDYGLALLTAVLILVSFPSLDIEWLAWIAFVPLLLALEGKTCWQAFRLSYVTGFVYFVGVTYWVWLVPDFTVIDFLLLTLYFPHYVSLWGVGLVWIHRRTGLATSVIAPVLWVCLEFVRSHFFFLAAPWMLIGHSQYLNIPIIQMTSITGVYGLSFLVLLVNVTIYLSVQYFRNRWRSSEPALPSRFPIPAVLASSMALLSVYLYGVVILAGALNADRLTLTLVQGNIPQSNKWAVQDRVAIMDTYAQLTRRAAESPSSLIVWPETAVPGDVRHHPVLQQAVQALAESTATPLLVGSAENAKFSDKKLKGKFYNGMYLITPQDGITGEYRKMGLVPFGEYVPGKEWIRWPEAIASTMGDMTPGDEFTIFRLGSISFGTTICWETLFPDHFREFVRRGAQFMISSTNEAWFGATVAPHQVLAMTVFRASENRIAIGRVANTGLSAFIDPYGRIVDRIRDEEGRELFVGGVLRGEVPLLGGGTFYTHYGDVFAMSQIVLCVSFLFSIALSVVKFSRLHPAPAQTKEIPMRRWTFIGRRFIFVGVLAAGVALSTPAYSDDAAVLPKGTFRFFADTHFYQPFDERFDKDGHAVKYAQPFNAPLNSVLIPSLAPLNGFVPGGVASFGTSKVTFDRHLQESIFQLAYGASDRLSLGVNIPYFWMQNTVNASVDSSASSGANIGFNPGFPGGIAPLAVPGTTRATTDDIQSLLAKQFGLKPVKTWQDSGIGDIEVGGRYQYYRGDDVRAAFTGGVRFPTGQIDDPDNLVDTAMGRGAYALLFQLQQDYLHQKDGLGKRLGYPDPGEWFINTTFRYDWNLPTTQNLRVCPGGGVFCNIKDDVHVKFGDQTQSEISGRLGLFVRGLNFSPLYQYSFKFKDHYSGGRGLDYGSLNQQLDNTRGQVEQHIYILALTYSTIYQYIDKNFPVPMVFQLSYRERFAGTGGTPKSNYIGFTVEVYF